MTTIAQKKVGEAGWLIIDDTSGKIRFYLEQGYTATHFLDPKNWSGRVNNVNVNGTYTWPSGGGKRLIAGPWTVSTNQTVTFAIGPTGTDGFGNGGSVSVAVSRATVPPAPTPVASTPDQITATSMRYQFNGNGTGGATFLRWEYQYSTSPTFASGNSALLTSGGTSIVQGLAPTTTYYFRSRGVNSLGAGPWSAIKSGATLTPTAPGLSVVPALDGQAATVTLTPPSQIPSPSSYKLEYRPLGGATTAADVASSPQVVSPLSPGATYEWRAAAVSGSTVSPYTAWTAVQQPNTNTNPGDFFDGNNAARADISYAWDGTVNNSTSRAVGKAVTGWGAFATGTAVSGGVGAVYRVTGGRSQAYAARVDFWSPTTAAGFHAGTSLAAGHTFPVSAGGSYNALVHVRLPVRGQRLAAMIIWTNSGGAEVGRTIGPDQQVTTSATDWTGLKVSGDPPVGAVGGAVRVIDVAGVGWSLWAAGDTILLDDAIAPFNEYYFDGSTPDTADFDYLWDGTINASASRRLVSTTPPPNPLADPDCPPVPAPPRPPAIADSCVDENVTEWRRIWQDITRDSLAEWIDSVPILRLQTTVPVRQVRVRYYPNPFDRPLFELEPGDFCSEQIISFIPGNAIFTLDGVTERAWAEIVGTPGTFEADYLLRSDTSLWPVVGCGMPYYITIDVPTDVPQNGIEMDYSLVPRY